MESLKKRKKSKKRNVLKCEKEKCDLNNLLSLFLFNSIMLAKQTIFSIENLL